MEKKEKGKKEERNNLWANQSKKPRSASAPQSIGAAPNLIGARESPTRRIRGKPQNNERRTEKP